MIVQRVFVANATDRGLNMNYKLYLERIADKFDHEWQIIKFEWQYGDLPALIVFLLGSAAASVVWFFELKGLADTYNLNFLAMVIISITFTQITLVLTFIIIFFLMACVKWAKSKINQLEKTKRGGPC